MKCEPGFAEAGPDPFGEYLGSGSRNPVRVRWETQIPAAPDSGLHALTGTCQQQQRSKCKTQHNTFYILLLLT